MIELGPPNTAGTTELDDGRHLGWASYGAEDGYPLLWFHGTPGARHQLPPPLPRTAEAMGIRVIGVERPGAGESTPHHYDRVVDFVPDVIQVANRFDLERFFVVGLSGGGPYAHAVAHQHPDRVRAAGIIGGLGPCAGDEAVPSYTKLLGVANQVLRPTREVLGSGLATIARPAVPVASQAYDAFTLVVPADRKALLAPGMKPMFISDLLRAIDHGLRAPAYDMALFGRHWGFRLSEITVPVRYWQGDADTIVPFSHGEWQASLVPDSELVRVEGKGHFGGYTQTDDLLETLLAIPE